MSYILDALRRADAERERDPARGIHAQPGAGAPAAVRAQVPDWAWPVGALALVGAALVFAWQRPGPEATAPQPAVAVAPPPAAPAAVPATAAPTVVAVADAVSPPAPPMPLKPPVERVKPSAIAAARPHAPVAPGATAPATATAPAPAPAPAPSPSPAATTLATAAAAPVTAGPPAAAPAVAGNAPGRGAPSTARLAPASAAPVATAAANRVFNPAELPADVQGALPKLAITGGVYSANAAQRMLVVGGQVVNEGAELAPGVVLDQIRAHSAVLRFRGYRYAVTY